MGLHSFALRCLGLLLSALLVGAPSYAEEHANPHEFTREGKPHHLPYRDPASVRNAATAGATLAAQTLTYYGGPVVSSVKVVKVLYGAPSATNVYQPFISGTGPGSMDQFFGQVVVSPHLDWLNEYNTSTPLQTINRGSFTGSKAITPAAANFGATITDAQIQTEIKTQIAAGNIPAPTADTYYALFFPKGKSISMGTSKSCVAGGFCAYHGTIASASGNILYGVHPDNSAGSGCDVGCGTSASPFSNATSVASHELVETITDPAVGLATVIGLPLAWYNARYGEIGDICNGQQGSFTGADGLAYTVQKEWSNVWQACIDVAPVPVAIGVSPTTVSMAVTATASVNVTVTNLSTRAAEGPVTLSVSNLPKNVTASFSPPSVKPAANGVATSVLTLKTTKAAKVNNLLLKIVGVNGPISASNTLSLTIK